MIDSNLKTPNSKRKNQDIQPLYIDLIETRNIHLFRVFTAKKAIIEFWNSFDNLFELNLRAIILKFAKQFRKTRNFEF